MDRSGCDLSRALPFLSENSLFFRDRRVKRGGAAAARCRCSGAGSGATGFCRPPSQPGPAGRGDESRRCFGAVVPGPRLEGARGNLLRPEQGRNAAGELPGPVRRADRPVQLQKGSDHPGACAGRSLPASFRPGSGGQDTGFCRSGVPDLAKTTAGRNPLRKPASGA